jgi:hypothetical protein
MNKNIDNPFASFLLENRKKYKPKITDSRHPYNKSRFINAEGNFSIPKKLDMTLDEIILEFQKIDLSYDLYIRGGAERGTIDPELKKVYIRFLKAILHNFK